MFLFPLQAQIADLGYSVNKKDPAAQIADLGYSVNKKDPAPVT